MFKRYPKIRRLGLEETDGVLEGKVHVEEKIDGANAQIWLSEDGIACGSRNNTLCKDVTAPTEGTNMFNGLVEWCANNAELHLLFTDHPEYRLYGEWLVRHTIHYKETAYKQFYLFDITVRSSDDEQEEFFSREQVHEIAKEYGLNVPEYHGVFSNPTVEELNKFVGTSVLGVEGEGIVLKNEEFVDKFGNQTYAKIVTQAFKENNGITFGGNNKHSETYWEMWITNKYITLPRVQKIMHKLEPVIGERLDLKHIPRIANSVYHDMLTEEIWEIQKKAQSINFRQLQRLALKKAIQIYKDILLGSVSVADKE